MTFFLIISLLCFIIRYVSAMYLLSMGYSLSSFSVPLVEFVRHDVITLGDCPAQSKFQMTEECSLPTTETHLLSFIGLCTFYNHYYHWFEKDTKPLRKLKRYFHHVQLQFMAWYPSLISLLYSCKSNNVTPFLLLR